VQLSLPNFTVELEIRIQGQRSGNRVETGDWRRRWKGNDREKGGDWRQNPSTLVGEEKEKG